MTRFASLELDNAFWLDSDEQYFERSLFSFPPEERRGINFGDITHIEIFVDGHSPERDGVYIAEIVDVDDNSYVVMFEMT